VCATYRKQKGKCNSHQIRNVVIEQLLLDDIRRVTSYAREHEDEFVRLVTQKSKQETDRNLREGKKELEAAKARISKLDGIIQRLYEDNIEGKVSDERFVKLTATYEAEQRELERRIAELENIMATTKNESLGVDTFLTLVRRYTDIKELDAELIRMFVEKILVYKAEKVDGHRVQRIKIIYNGIGEIPNAPINEKTA
jgi:peptidoglycan hydrolase CwlO-like protein